jgi:predicted transcriptional regulator
MNGALLSVRPRFAQGIIAGTKTIELRRRAPSCAPGDLVIVYETSPTKAIVGFAVVSKIDGGCTTTLWRSAQASAGVSHEEYRRYFDGAPSGVAIHLKEAKALRRPIALSEARSLAPEFRPPQSWCYLRSLPAALVSRLRQVVKTAKKNGSP